jgi:hypothetical protein
MTFAIPKMGKTLPLVEQLTTHYFFFPTGIHALVYFEAFGTNIAY